MAYLLASEHLLLASLSVDLAFSYSLAYSVCSIEHTNAEFWQSVDWLLWVMGPPRYRQQVGGLTT